MNSSKTNRKTFNKMDYWPKIWKLSKITKNCNMYVIFKLLFNNNLLFGFTAGNSQSLWSDLRLILLARHFGGVNSSKSSRMFIIMVYGSSYLRKPWQAIHFLQKKVENMMIIPWSCHESWRPCHKTWSSCRHHGKVMTRQAFFPTRVNINLHFPKPLCAVLKSLRHRTNDFFVLCSIMSTDNNFATQIYVWKMHIMTLPNFCQNAHYVFIWEFGDGYLVIWDYFLSGYLEILCLPIPNLTGFFCNFSAGKLRYYAFWIIIPHCFSAKTRSHSFFANFWRKASILFAFRKIIAYSCSAKSRSHSFFVSCCTGKTHEFAESYKKYMQKHTFQAFLLLLRQKAAIFEFLSIGKQNL